MEINHIDTRIKIQQRKLCMNCPSRLDCKEGETIKLGFGNINANKVIVLPSYNIYEKGNYISGASVLIKYIGYDKLLEDYYVTRDIKCWNVSSYDTHDTCASLCAPILTSELSRINAKHLFVFGNVDLSVIHPRILRKFIIHRILNPYVMLTEVKPLKDTFLEQIDKMKNI